MNQLLLLLLLLFIPCAAFGQDTFVEPKLLGYKTVAPLLLTPGGKTDDLARQLPIYASAPTCSSVGQMYFDSVIGHQRNCTAVGSPGTWETIGGAVGGTWGTITGTLSDQTDLQTALDLKAPLASPTFSGVVKSPVFASTNADPADANIIRLGNAELIAWEKAVAGTDWTLGVNSSDQLESTAPFKAPSFTTTGVGGVGAFINAVEGTVPTGSDGPAVGHGVVYWDSTAHRPLFSNNNGAFDSILGRATTDTLTNKTFDTAGTGNSFSINSLAATTNTGTGAVVRATSPALTTPTGIVKGDVGLGNVDNTSDVNKPVSTAQQTALNLKANIAAPVFTTSITSPVFISAAADPADANVVRLGNNELIAWEKATPGTDWTLGVNASDQLVSTAPFVIGAGGAITSSGTGGALGTAAFTAASAYEVPLTFSTGLTRSTNTITVNTSQNIATLSNLTSSGLVVTSGGVGTLGVTVPGTGVLTALGVNVGSAGAFVTFNGALGTPSAGTLTNATGLPVGGLSNLGSNVGTFLITPSGANLATALTTALPVSKGGTNCTAATVTCFNNITGFTAAGTTGTTSTNLVFSTSPTINTSLLLSGVFTQTSNSATAFESGPNGSTNPVVRIINSTASQADGISITGGAAGNGTTLTALSSGSNAGFTFTPKGTGVVLINSAGTSATPSLSVSTAGNGFYAGAANNIDLALGAARSFSFQGGGFLYLLNNTATLFFGASNDTAVGRAAAGKLAVTIGTTDCSTVAWCADLTLKSIIASGTSPTISSGTIGTGARNAAGFFTSLTTGAYSGFLTFNGTTAPVGWGCAASNNTTGNLIRQTASSTTTATFGGTTVSGDVITYVCTAY